MNTKLLTAAVLAFCVSFGAQASLTSSGDLTVFDSDQNLTWTKDANLSLTLGNDAEGQMDWATAVAWADNLEYAGYTDWVLPTITQLTNQFFTNLGVEEYESIRYFHNDSYDLFTNIQSSVYWSGSEHATNPGYAWGFDTAYGDLYTINTYYQYFAWAVRPGDVAASAPAAVPLPSATWLFLSGLMGVVGLKRRKNID